MVKKIFFLLVWLAVLLNLVFMNSARSQDFLKDMEEKGRKSMIRAAQADVTRHIPTALQLYKIDNGAYPTTAQGLAALLEKPTLPPTPANWTGPYLQAMPKDPWGESYKYACPGMHNQNSFDLWSLGQDGIESEDDITNWKIQDKGYLND